MVSIKETLGSLLKQKEMPERRETILDKRHAESEAQILINLSDYFKNSSQSERIEQIIEHMQETLKVKGFETTVHGWMFKSRSDNLFYQISVKTSKGELYVEIPVKMINNHPTFTFTKNNPFTILYRNAITKSVKLVGTI